MALGTHGPHTATPSVTPTQARERKSKHRGIRITLVMLEAFMLVTTVSGAIFVVPYIPVGWLHQGLIAPFADYTIPALALGVLCGGAALGALVTVLGTRRGGALASIGAGVFMVGFELVEILVVGFTPVLDPTQPQAWLQPFFILLGVAIALLGVRLWTSETES